jgi:hypothetical protein
VERQVGQANVFDPADAVFGAGAAVVPRFGVGQLPAAGVGGKQVIRRPSWSTGRSCAPGCGTSRRAMTRVRAGHPVRFSSPVIGHVGAVARFAVAVVGRGPRRLREPDQGVGASCQVFCVRPCCWVRGRVRGRSEVSLAPLSSGEGKAGGLVVEQGLKDGIGEAALEYAKCLASAVSTALAPFDHLFGRRMPTGLGECDAV